MILAGDLGRLRGRLSRRTFHVEKGKKKLSSLTSLISLISLLTHFYLAKAADQNRRLRKTAGEGWDSSLSSLSSLNSQTFVEPPTSATKDTGFSGCGKFAFVPAPDFRGCTLDTSPHRLSAGKRLKRESILSKQIPRRTNAIASCRSSPVSGMSSY
jgi:hypothetical protein